MQENGIIFAIGIDNKSYILYGPRAGPSVENH